MTEITPEQKFKLLVQERPWEHEPNEAQWVDEATGYRCEIKRHKTMLHLCGYVQLPTNHPMRNEGYGDASDYVTEELTYSEKGVFGFDCAHADDLSPGLVINLMQVADDPMDTLATHMNYGTYKTWGEVVRRVETLAREFKELDPKGEMK